MTDAPPAAEARDLLWTSAEAALATGGRALGRWVAHGVSIDSRSLAPGDLFVALIAERDGHAFVKDALARGAAAVLVSQSTGEGPALVVPDTLEALRQLGAAARMRTAAVRVAVTGSVGKTSVKEAIAAVFARVGAAHASAASFNNHLGAPLTLARMPRATERAVFELGMNHAGEIRPLSGLVRPHIALVTTIGPAHIENLGSLEAIADAKAEIFEGLEPWGAAIVPGDDAFAARLAARAGAAGAGWLVRFGTDQQAEARLLAFDTDGAQARGEVDVFGRRVAFHLRTGAVHAGLNTAAVLAAVYLADAPLEAAVEVLAGMEGLPGRGLALSLPAPGGGEFVLVDDAYNANPASVRAALDTLSRRPRAPDGRRILALGEMRELGAFSPEMHRELAAPIATAGVDLVYLTGAGTSPLYDALDPGRRGGWAATAVETAAALAGVVRSGDVVLVKGSNSSRMGDVVAALKSLT